MSDTSDKEQRALLHLIEAERSAFEIGDTGVAANMPAIEAVGIVGAGTMGRGIAMNFLDVGMPVTLVEADEDALENSVALIRQSYEGQAARGKIAAEVPAERLSFLSPTTDLARLSGADLVIEAVFEQMDVKKDVFAKLSKACGSQAILATNTSYLDIDEIAAVTDRPERVLGLHFFTPANVMRLLEIVRTDQTRPDVLTAATALAVKIGKLPVTVRNGYGFVGNRMLRSRAAQVDELVLEGAHIEDVDRTLCDFGFPMGHFTMIDLVGLDVGWDRSKKSASTVREALNLQGRHGRKTQAGFYDYDQGGKPIASPAVLRTIEEFAAKAGVVRRSVGDEEILARVICATINEGARILDEGIAARSSDIDLIWVHGYGWPRNTGGPMYWAEQQGMISIHEQLKTLERAHGAAFTPSSLIDRLVNEGKRFSDIRPDEFL